MEDAVTIIVGAGAVLDFEHKGLSPSVDCITKEILKLSIQKVDGSERFLIKELYEHIIAELKHVGSPDLAKYYPPRVNFEDLLHVLEMCLTYSSCWHNEYLQWTSLPLFGLLIGPQPILHGIDTIEFERAAYSLEKKVIEIVNEYDSSFRESASSEKWYRDFWCSLKRSNIYTLNYDTTIEESVCFYEDGYVEEIEEVGYSRFSANQYYENAKNGPTIGHLHGSILFSEPLSSPYEYDSRQLVKNVDIEVANKVREMTRYTPRTQAKERYAQANIISGARKTDKMICAPYNVYLSDLTRRILMNNRLIIVGYSFGDLYLNNILELGVAAHGDGFKVVILDKFPKYINDYPAFFQHLEQYCNYGELSFISRLVGDRLHIKPGQKEYPLSVKGCDTPILSKNGKLMMCIGGFKDAVEQQGEAIREFLKS